MELFESIYFLIMFTIPAAINIVLNVYVARINRLNKDSTILLAENIVFCGCVFGVNCLIMREQIIRFANYAILSDAAEQAAYLAETGFNPLLFGVRYFIVNCASAVVCFVVWILFGRTVLVWIKNRWNKKQGRDEEASADSIWEMLFEVKDYIDIDKCIICIERGGQVITAGEIAAYSQPTAEQKCFLLRSTDAVKEAFDDDKQRAPEYKIFHFADFEYYDIEKDLLLKFYNGEKYRRAYETSNFCHSNPTK